MAPAFQTVLSCADRADHRYYHHHDRPAQEFEADRKYCHRLRYSVLRTSEHDQRRHSAHRVGYGGGAFQQPWKQPFPWLCYRRYSSFHSAEFLRNSRYSAGFFSIRHAHVQGRLSCDRRCLSRRQRDDGNCLFHRRAGGTEEGRYLQYSVQHRENGPDLRRR